MNLAYKYINKFITLFSKHRFEKLIFLLLLIILSLSVQSQNQSTYSFYVAGHAYGAHAGTNIGLHPPFLKKLEEYKDTVVTGIFLTGDIVNLSNQASWTQVEKELSDLGLTSYYVMGNHDNNSIGKEVFGNKHGGLYYYFDNNADLFIVLNSTESDRSISKTQLQFLDSAFINEGLPWDRAFIFFHEVIWNSNEKYRLLRSNSRSRYAQLSNISNFWTDVYPRLSALSEKKFYLFAGDVGGNPDAIAASWDVWENVTLLSSGMGEVKDENFLKVNVLPDTVTFRLIPLNDSVQMNPVTWYNIPEKPDSILGTEIISEFQTEADFQISPVFNATSYKWILNEGITGSSDSSKITLNFLPEFKSGEISAVAVNDGFGESDLVTKEIQRAGITETAETRTINKFRVMQNQEKFQIEFYSENRQITQLQISNISGQIIYNEQFYCYPGSNTKVIRKYLKERGLLIFRLSVGQKTYSSKIVQF